MIAGINQADAEAQEQIEQDRLNAQSEKNQAVAKKKGG